jgi:hypothetical protein
MQFRSAGLDLTIRTILAAALAFGVTTLAVFESHAGPTPSPGTATPSASPTATPEPTPDVCDFHCDLDKLCSVGASEPQDQCVASPGEEVTYHYEVNLAGGPVDVWDDQLGFIGSTNGTTLTRTTTLSETTTNWGSLVASAGECGCGECFCAFGNPTDAVTVTVSGPTPTPTATPTPSPTSEPTPTPVTCAATWSETTIVTAAKGQSPTNNAKVSHAITGHIIDPGSLRDTAHRIEVCAGTQVTSTVTDATGSPTNTAAGGLLCTPGACSGVVDVTEKYRSISQDGKDKDSIAFIPK